MELDVLTGEYTILRADLVYDCGIALNPALDIGQLEGCYMMAAGMVLMEDQQHSLVDGRLIGAGAAVDDCLARQSVSLRTLSVLKCRDVGLQDYKPPSALDIPLEFNIWFTQTPNKAAGNVLGSKPATEPGPRHRC